MSGKFDIRDIKLDTNPKLPKRQVLYGITVNLDMWEMQINI